MTQENRVVLITGSAGGIGRATVKLFSEKNWVVIGVDRSDFGEGFPKNGLFIKKDVSKPEQIVEMYQLAAAFSLVLLSRFQSPFWKLRSRNGIRPLPQICAPPL